MIYHGLPYNYYGKSFYNCIWVSLRQLILIFCRAEVLKQWPLAHMWVPLRRESFLHDFLEILKSLKELFSFNPINLALIISLRKHAYKCSLVFYKCSTSVLQVFYKCSIVFLWFILQMFKMDCIIVMRVLMMNELDCTYEMWEVKSPTKKSRQIYHKKWSYCFKTFSGLKNIRLHYYNIFILFLMYYVLSQCVYYGKLR